MALVINSNIASLNAQRQLSSSQNTLDTTMERLASGKRINSAGDDAAGLAISNRMTSQIRGLDQAVRNANDGISMIQTAEGALSESTNILQRMRELSIQSANGIYSNEDRASLQAEVEQMKSELTRIAETTSFNGQKILDGTLGEIGLQVGSEANETISLNMGSGFDAASLGASEGGVSSGSFTLAETSSTGLSGASGSLETLDAGDLTINGIDIPAAQTSSDTVSSSDNAASAISLAEAINSVSDETGVVAEANATTYSLDMANAFSATSLGDGDLVINGVDLAAASGITGSNAGLVDHINSFADQTGVTASVSGNKLTFTAVDGRNIQLESDAGTATITATAIDTVQTGTVTLRSNEAIDIGGNEPAALGFEAGAVEANTNQAMQDVSSAASFDLTVVYNGDATDVLTINGQDISYDTTVDAETSAQTLMAEINKHYETTGVRAEEKAPGVLTLTGIKDVEISYKTAGGTNTYTTSNLSDGDVGAALTAAGASQVVDQQDFESMANGDLTVNGYTVDFEGAASSFTDTSFSSGYASAAFTAAAINNTDGLKDQVVATAYTEVNLGKVSGADMKDDFSLTINGLNIDIDNPIKDNDENGNLVGQLNTAFSGAAEGDEAYGLVASINDDGELLISADDGRNITISVAAGSDVGGNTQVVNGESLLANFDVTRDSAITAKGTVSLEAKDGFSINEIGGDKRSLAGIESGGNSVADIDITTAAGAQEAIDILDRAIETIGQARGDLGAVNNRLDFTISNLSNVSENASAARSRIVDADFAKETANLSRAQVLQQASQAMLAQANARPQQVLSLLQ
ncbi:flagellin [Marinobacterium sediminicola]|uniref:Flagellin n=1 Tax=Marinobacterium sediminicola TaxID=518898 RepID=A0ABY1RYL7_9GAMM|nr:flagellin [Marinobacterium sediminicola]SMR73320.1 flagellin [Marinobacterium sediminicola]